MQQRSPLALRTIKRCLNAELDGQHGLMQLAGDNLMYYLMDEAHEGKMLFEKRAPDFKQFPNSGNPPMAAPKVWVSAARLRTLPLSLSGIL